MPDTGDLILGAHSGPQGVDRLVEQPIVREAMMVVVGRLEIVDHEQDERELVAMAPGAGGLALESLGSASRAEHFGRPVEGLLKLELADPSAQCPVVTQDAIDLRRPPGGPGCCRAEIQGAVDGHGSSLSRMLQRRIKVPSTSDKASLICKSADIHRLSRMGDLTLSRCAPAGQHDAATDADADDYQRTERMTLVGVWLASSASALYPAHLAAARELGVSALADQSSAGAILWLGGSLVLVAAVLGLG